ncbi:hypothetical protein [Streptomyces sp. C]|uniref:hypothetical protein n=1 Tax=Streptomyces sp. C TaxID=253839 RepID=UPI0001B57BED|nr:hypothetical protein [Streptomyces sp. C]EFL12761.1 predicted protein [Streptomyces sp. C]
MGVRPGRRPGRRWTYDRLRQPCAELATHTVTDTAGASLTACTVHTAEAEQQITRATVTPLPHG